MTAFLCGYREYGGLEVSSHRWGNEGILGGSVLGGIKEVEGGGVVGRKMKEDDGGEVRRLELHRMLWTTLIW